MRDSKRGLRGVNDALDLTAGAHHEVKVFIESAEALFAELTEVSSLIPNSAGGTGRVRQ